MRWIRNWLLDITKLTSHTILSFQSGFVREIKFNFNLNTVLLQLLPHTQSQLLRQDDRDLRRQVGHEEVLLVQRLGNLLRIHRPARRYSGIHQHPPSRFFRESLYKQLFCTVKPKLVRDKIFHNNTDTIQHRINY